METQASTLKPPSIHMRQVGDSAVASYSLHEGSLADSQWQDLQDHCKHHDVSEGVFFLAVYASVLEHFSKSGAFSIAVATADAPSVRFCLVAADLSSGALAFQDVASQVAASLQKGQQQLGDGGSAGPALEPCQAFTFALGTVRQLQVQDLGLPPGICKVHATVQVMEGQQGVLYRLAFLKGVFPEEVSEGIVSTYRRLVTELCTGGTWEKPVRKLLPAVNPVPPITPNTALPQDLLHEPFLRSCSKDSSRVAIVDTSAAEPLTYGQLEALSGAVRDWLVPHVVGEGDATERVVAVMMDRGWRQHVAVLGALRAQCTYMPIDSSFPRAVAERMVKLGGALALVTQAAVLERSPWVPELGVPVANLDNLPSAPLEPGARMPTPATPRSMAYLLYTSGTTGKPKGVACHHQGAVNTIYDLIERFHLGPEDRVLALPSSLGFDLSVFDIFGTFAAGASVVVPRTACVLSPDPEEWLRLIWEHRATMWSVVPAYVEQLATYLERCQKRLPPWFRLCWMSGDWIPVTLAGRLRALSDCPELQVISMGGATEAAVWSNTFEIGPEPLPGWSSVPYGVPMKNQTMYILDQNLDHCEPWVTGVIHIGGAGVALGYYKDPERSAKQFFNHPETGEWLFRTGDLGRLRPGPLLEILGREDMVIGVNGFRVELNDIGRALEEYPGVQDALVVMDKGSHSGPRKELVPFVTPKAALAVNGDPDTAARALEELSCQVAEHARATLPPGLVPSATIAVRAMPLTGNGKLDAKALLQIYEARRAAAVSTEKRGPGGEASPQHSKRVAK